MLTPFSKCKYCDKRIGFRQWWKTIKEGYIYAMRQIEAGADKETVERRVRDKFGLTKNNQL